MKPHKLRRKIVIVLNIEARPCNKRYKFTINDGCRSTSEREGRGGEGRGRRGTNSFVVCFSRMAIHLAFPCNLIDGGGGNLIWRDAGGEGTAGAEASCNAP